MSYIADVFILLLGISVLADSGNRRPKTWFRISFCAALFVLCVLILCSSLESAPLNLLLLICIAASLYVSVRQLSTRTVDAPSSPKNSGPNIGQPG